MSETHTQLRRLSQRAQRALDDPDLSHDQRRAAVAEIQDRQLALIAEVIDDHPVAQLAAASGLSRQKIYRNIDVPAKPIGPGLRDEQFAARIGALTDFVDRHGKLPTYHEDRSLSRWLSNCRSALRGGNKSSLVLTEARIAELDEAAPGWRKS